MEEVMQPNIVDECNALDKKGGSVSGHGQQKAAAVER